MFRWALECYCFCDISTLRSDFLYTGLYEQSGIIVKKNPVFILITLLEMVM